MRDDNDKRLVPVNVQSSFSCKQAINVGKAAGPLDPYMKLFKLFPSSFAIPLANISNESFLSRSFPKIWKFYTVCGIPKAISLTSFLSKVQESYVVEWMYDNMKGKVREEQFRGLPGSSVVFALVSLAHKWLSAMEDI